MTLFTEKDMMLMASITPDEYDISDIDEYILEAADSKTYILRDAIYPGIEAVLKTPSGDRQFKSLVERFIDRNSEKLNEPCPINLIPFTDNDKNDYYRLFNTNEKAVKSVIKEALTKVSDVAKFRLVNQNPIFVVFYCVIRYYTFKKDKQGINSATAIYALAAYPSIFSKYFKYGANEGVMRYTADQLTEKYIFKTAGNVFKALTTSMNSSYTFLAPFFSSMEDVEVVRFIQRVRNDQNSLIKKIAIRYNDNFVKGNSIQTQNETYDTGEIIDDIQNDTSIVELIADKVSLNIITQGINLNFLKIAATWSQISMIELRIYVTQILVNKKMDELKTFITSILFVYLFDEKHKKEEIHSKQWISYGISLFRRTNSNDKNIETIKATLNKWGNDTGIHSKFNREHTQSDYKKGIFWYIMLSIQNIA